MPATEDAVVADAEAPPEVPVCVGLSWLNWPPEGSCELAGDDEGPDHASCAIVAPAGSAAVTAGVFADPAAHAFDRQAPAAIVGAPAAVARRPDQRHETGE